MPWLLTFILVSNKASDYCPWMKCLLLLLFQELCGEGGALFLAQAILTLNTTPLFRESSSVVAAVSRLKSKILAIVSLSDWQKIFYWTLEPIENSHRFLTYEGWYFVQWTTFTNQPHAFVLQLLHLCEAESISYLDEVASSPRSMPLAKSVLLEVGS